MSNPPDLFNKAHIRQFRARAQKNFSTHDFVYSWAARDITDRLSDIKRKFESVLLMGPHVADYFKQRFETASIMDDPTPDGLVAHAGQSDLIISMGDMHHMNDLPGLLIQMRRALKPDGVMIAAFAGGSTLHELRASLMSAEMRVMDGASPRIYPFTDKQQMAGLMQRAGFALPVVDSEILDVSYRDMFHLMDDVRGMGESNALAARYKSMTPSGVFATAAEYYQQNFPDGEGRIKASFEIIFIIGWAPHESQQKPAKRGSGQVSLAEVL